MSDGSPSAKRWVLMVIGLAGAVMGLTLLFLGMRAVMEVGGVCGSGSTVSVPRVQCPKGVPGVMMLGIFGGLIFLGIYVFNAIGVNLGALAWPALFLSLGWNFLVYGLDPPVGDVSVGWLVCAVLFGLMGGVPLVIGLWAWRNGRTKEWRSVQATRRVAGSRFGPVDEEHTRRIKRIAIAVQQASIVAGVWIGIQIFEAATDTSVGFGVR